MKFLRKILSIATLLAALAPSSSFACAACYGKSDSPLASGMNWGIFTLLGVILPVLGCFGFCLVRLINKDETSDKNKNAPENITDV